MSIGGGLFGGGGGLGDPLAGLTLPPGDPGSLYATAATYSAMGSGLESSASRQSQAMAGVGPAWIGNGAVSCQAAVNQLGASSRKVATSANNAAVVLKTCAGRWEQAKARWAQAQNLAAQATAEEAAQRNRVSQQAAAGNPVAGIDQALGLAYESPLRSQATALGQAAIDDFNAATNTAKGGLAGAAAPITPHIPRAPAHQGGLLNDLKGVAKASVRDLQTVGNWTLGFLGDPNNQKVFQDGTAMSAGLGMILLGAGGEIGGTLLDGTIVLSPAGVALNAASGVAIGAGAAGVGYGAWHMGSDIPNMNFAKNYDGLGARPQPTPTPAGGDAYNPNIGGRVDGYGGYKTEGQVHLDGDPQDLGRRLLSGRDGPFQNLPPAPRPGTGYNGRVLTHVEAHATALMRTRGVQRATLYLNRLPCPGGSGCSAMLPRFVPQGSTLTVYGPDGFAQVIHGTGAILP